jgi:sulfoxide reductase catalytic subunit YedY
MAAVALTAGFPLSWALSFAQRALAETRKIVLPKGTKREELIQKNPAELDARHLELTSVKDFGTMGTTDYRADIRAWRLFVDGHVRNPFSLSLEEMQALPHIEKNALLICPGFFANHGRWRGISVSELLRRAGLKKGATHITFRGPESRDEKTDRFPIQEILSDKVFLADQVNGESLPEKHGFPLRLVAEDHYGYEWVKYVYRVTAEKIDEGS